MLTGIFEILVKELKEKKLLKYVKLCIHDFFTFRCYLYNNYFFILIF